MSHELAAMCVQDVCPDIACCVITYSCQALMHRINNMEMGSVVKSLMTGQPSGKNVSVWARFRDFTVHAVDYLDRRLTSNSAIMSLHQLVTHVNVGFSCYLSKE